MSYGDNITIERIKRTMEKAIRIRPTSVGMLDRGQGYSVKDLGTTMQGYVNLREKEIGVSLNADAAWTRFVQLHELGHIKYSRFSPKKMMQRAGCTHSELNAAEDARVNTRVRRAVPDFHDGFDFPPNTPFNATLDGYCASHECPPALRAELARQLLAKMGPHAHIYMRRIDEKIAKLLKKRKLTASSFTIPLAKFLHKLNKELNKEMQGRGKGPQPPQPPQGQDEEPQEGQGRPGDEQPEEQEQEPEEQEGEGSGGEEGEKDEEKEEKEEKKGKKGKKEDEEEQEGDEEGEEEEGEEDEQPGQKGDGQGDGQGDEQGDEQTVAEAEAEAEEEAKDEEEMGTEEPWKDGHPPMPIEKSTNQADEGAWLIPEPHTLPPSKAVQRPGTHNKTSAVMGTKLRDVTKLRTTGKVYGRSLLRPGAIKRGVFLIDNSGSMGLTTDNIIDIVNAVPSAVVAIYDACRSIRGREESDYGPLPKSGARILIVARDGKVADLSKIRTLGDNYCDGPALLWLSRQPGPRFWYCDGLVTKPGGLISFETAAAECFAICKAAKITHINPHGHGTSGWYMPGITLPSAKGYVEGHGQFVVRALREARLVR